MLVIVTNLQQPCQTLSIWPGQGRTAHPHRYQQEQQPSVPSDGASPCWIAPSSQHAQPLAAAAVACAIAAAVGTGLARGGEGDAAGGGVAAAAAAEAAAPLHACMAWQTSTAV